MPLAGGTLRVEGLTELQRHFAIIDKELAGDLRDGLKRAAEPVKATAERLTLAKIGMGRVPWYQMRLGVTQAGVYMVPKQRNRNPNPRRRRRSYRDTVLPRMITALEMNEHRVMGETERVLNSAIDKWGRGG